MNLSTPQSKLKLVAQLQALLHTNTKQHQNVEQGSNERQMKFVRKESLRHSFIHSVTRAADSTLVPRSPNEGPLRARAMRSA